MIRAVVFMLQILICRRVTEGQTQAFALGRRWRRSRRMRGKILVLQPLITRYAGAVSLRLGHITALTVHRTVIHYRDAASLPQGEASRLSTYITPTNQNLKGRVRC